MTTTTMNSSSNDSKTSSSSDDTMNCSMDKFEGILHSLKKMAKRSCLSQKHGACLLQGNKIFSLGVNKYFRLNLPDHEEIPVTIHAEVDALSNIHSKYIKGMDILIIRVNKSLNLINSRPCNSCIEKLQQRGIRKAYYSTNEGKIVYEYVDSMPRLHDSSGVRNRRTSSS